MAHSSSMSFTRQNSYNELYSPLTGNDTWNGYNGRWYLGIKDGDEDVEPIRAMRLWKNRELGNMDKITQRNIYERLFLPGELRDIDGYPETFYERSVEDSLYEPNAFSVDSAGQTERRMIVLSTDVATSLQAQIPTHQKGKWGCESFIVDNKNSRWSVICTYDTETRLRSPPAMIQEYFIELSDNILDSSIEFYETPPPREKLSCNIPEWFGKNCVTSGSSIGMEVDQESGAFLRVPETSWESSTWPPVDMIKNLADGMNSMHECICLYTYIYMNVFVCT